GRDFNILVAGYVTKGENLENTLKRELKEETGLNVLSFKYNESQYFEKTNSLICNFIIQTDNEDFKLTSEVDSAKWYPINEVKDAIKKNSLAEYFLNLALTKIC
ncbi:MAG: NUDIX domain-containing protein, partial [Candidatus Riflebacteria bacterium]|nr:NUDIX domain-containing protein [Candidatus Riflebacteria bacterium]